MAEKFLGRARNTSPKEDTSTRRLKTAECPWDISAAVPFSPAEARPNETTVCIKGRQRPGH